MIDAAQPARFLVYRCLDLTIDCGRRLVLRGDETLAVGGLSFDLLVVLLEGAPNIVTTDELMTRVWQGVIVNPETISQRVKLLRQALGDDARAPRYIAVVRGRGYRAIATVKVMQGRVRPSDTWWLAGAMVVAFVLIVAIVVTRWAM